MEMENLVTELKKLIPFKDEIDIGDVVVLAGENPQMLAFAIITDINRDRTRKDAWWHVSMQMLSVPLQSITWTLRTEQMCGREIFTMGGDKRFMAPVRIAVKHRNDPLAHGKGEDGGSVKKKGTAGLRVVK